MTRDDHASSHTVAQSAAEPAHSGRSDSALDASSASQCAVADTIGTLS